MRPAALDAGAPAWFYGAVAGLVILDVLLFAGAAVAVAWWAL